jgi:hypothetical protein
LLHIISLGAGVQSSTMALMFAHGELTPMPDCAIFADTGAEPRYVYDWLDWLETKLPFPVHRVAYGNLRDDLTAGRGNSISGAGHIAQPPFFVRSPDGRAVSMLRRKCTQSYKIVPIERKVRELAGLAKGQMGPKVVAVTQYIGISYDEALRMKPSQTRWIVHRWPLVDLEMRRLDCERWMAANDYPKPQKSACTFCPYHDDAHWRDMKRDHPEAFAEAVAMDETIRGGWLKQFGIDEDAYVHRSLKPLAEIDFRGAKDFGQVSLFEDECEGMCGV